MIEIETFLRTVYMMFSRSSVNKEKFQELAKSTVIDAIALRPLYNVSWLSRHLAVTVLVRNYNTLINYFTDELNIRNDEISKYCLKGRQNPQFQSALIAINDISGEPASMCTYFQPSIRTSTGALQFVKSKICEIRSPHLGETIHLSDAVKEVID
ncbi:hypothetical protein RF11_09854 [Thelohanellus kitauei]|uniref:Uncharacterized protein n=1 Tax=Thelohanellus kitauei TaxID=669202 RepID=A0A0C2JZ55_THEKT|nr:hypothetical protein RF11_09854 [Thelohanellus kitauei]